VVNPERDARSGPMSPDASQIARHSDVMSHAVVYLPTPKAGASFTQVNARVAAPMAWVLAQLGQYHRAHRYGLYAYRALRNGQDHRTVGELGVTLGVCYARLGRNAEAIEWLQDAVATFRRIDDSDGLVSALREHIEAADAKRAIRRVQLCADEKTLDLDRIGLFQRNVEQGSRVARG